VINSIKNKIFIIFFISCLYSQTTGKISGIVYDTDNAPIIGASVSIVETGVGTATDYEGFYYILNLSPGTYTLKINMIGFKAFLVENVVVSVNKTTRIDIQMEESFIEGEEVVVTASKISTKKDQSGTIKNISEDQINILPIKDIESIVTMQAGVVDGHFRGGRSTEVTYLVDGMRTDDAYGGDSKTVYLEPSVLRDLEVITGTFNAEYGRAMSGVVNQVTKDGSNQFESSFSTRYENYFSANNNIFRGIDNPIVNLNQDYNFQFSGPIIKDKITFFLNSRYQDNLGHLNGYDFFNVSDRSNFMADNPSNYYSEHSGSHVIENYCSNSKGGEIYDVETGAHITDESECMQYGDCELIPYDILDEPLFFYSGAQFLIDENACINLGIDYEMSPRFIPAQIRYKNDSFVPMNNFVSSSILGKLTFKPSSRFKLSLINSFNQYQGSEWGEEGNFHKYSPDSRPTMRSENNFSSLFINYMLSSSSFMDFKFSYNQKENGTYVYKNPLDARYVADEYSVAESGFLQGGHNKWHGSTEINDFNLKFDFNSQINSIHNLKFGFDNFYHDLSVRNYTIKDANPDNPFIYIPTIDEGDTTTAYAEEYDVKSYEYSLYVQDKMEFSDMVINFGFRYDMFDPNTYYPSNYQDPDNSYYSSVCLPSVDQNGYLVDPEWMLPEECNNSILRNIPLEAKSNSQISPRFALSYQIDNALVRFSYGHFFQMPPLYAVYSNPYKRNTFLQHWNISSNDYQTILGNPNLDAEKTVNYEFGYWEEINSSMSYEIVVFNKDIYNLLTTTTIQTENEVKYGLYTNKDYGNARGLELIFDYYNGPLSLTANYTYQHTKGIADSPQSSFDREGENKDPLTRLLPLAWDQRHTFNLTFGYNQEKYGATLSAYFNSGTAFTFEPISENALAEINLEPNNAYKPSNYLMNLSSYYNFPSINSRITLEVYNLFDTLNEYGVNSQTGRAYSAILSESDQVSFRNNYTTIEDTYQDPSHYGAPRSIKIGLEIRY
tara:strand:+ start:7895 stop:10909 length:3015 start_codon:yes stop_codon:yes gene_type:complete